MSAIGVRACQVVLTPCQARFIQFVTIVLNLLDRVFRERCVNPRH